MENAIEIKSKDGIAISLKIAEKLNVDINDKVKWHIYGDGKWYESEITDIYRDPAEQGVIVSMRELEKIEMPFKTSYILSNEEKITGLDGVKTIENIEQSKENIMYSIYNAIINSSKLYILWKTT